MKITRKHFLRLSGLSLLAAAGKKLAGGAGKETPSEGAAGIRWGMVIDVKKCRQGAGCNRCILACNLAHNIPQLPDRMHEVKWIWKEPFEAVFPYASTGYAESENRGSLLPALCNHCANPPCVHVCPVEATWKREDGIVMMDWHRCIGCRYCMAACPYGARSFNWQDPRPWVSAVNASFPTRTAGVVEKCNFCEERLAKKLPPACVEACEAKAIVFGNLNDPASEAGSLLRSRFAMQREAELGTSPSVYYIV
jgi:molybdopterin-containing oxidoreductase family iron-sulfur binding subunit